MEGSLTPSRFLRAEARALLTRLNALRPFSLTMPSVASAMVSTDALHAVERHLATERERLRDAVRDFLRWLDGPASGGVSARDRQHRFTLLRLRFNSSLDQLDIFADALTQRGENDAGVRLAGLDVLAHDAMRVDEGAVPHPPLITYLDRGHGAAIRRARTRLPGGGSNPVAIIRVPRERMVGNGIGSSLVHEVGHQAAAQLDLVRTTRLSIRARGPGGPAWTLWDRWVSEILADFWAVAQLGVCATIGLIGVVSLPRAFVFRVKLDDPHPFPWIRVVLSCALGARLYPDAQWDRLCALWSALYPLDDAPDAVVRLTGDLRSTMPAFLDLLTEHTAPALGGRPLAAMMPLESRPPRRLRELYAGASTGRLGLRTLSPVMALAVMGQARADGRLSPEREAATLDTLLTHWAVRRAASVSPPRQPSIPPPAPPVAA